jgi:hypothetical protein
MSAKLRCVFNTWNSNKRERIGGDFLFFSLFVIGLLFDQHDCLITCHDNFL